MTYVHGTDKNKNQTIQKLYKYIFWIEIHGPYRPHIPKLWVKNL